MPNVALGVPKELREFRSLHPLLTLCTHLLLCRGWYVGPYVGHGTGTQICSVAVISAFGRLYLSDSHKILLKAIDELHNLVTMLKVLPIVQSSGMGKSLYVYGKSFEESLCGASHGTRMQMANQTHFLQHIGIPMLAPSSCAKCKLYFREFLSSLFISAHALSQHHFRGDKMTKYDDMARRFYEFYRTNRSSIKT